MNPYQYQYQQLRAQQAFAQMQARNHQRARVQGTAITPRGPPSIPSSDIGASVGVPIHVCVNNNMHCLKCRIHQHDSQRNFVLSSDGTARIEHGQINVVVATRARSARLGIPQELGGRLTGFDFTLQLSDMPGDRSSWLFSQEELLAIISPTTLDQSVVIRKPNGDSMTMSRVNAAGPGYVV